MRRSMRKNNAYGWYIALLSALFGCILTAGYPQFSMTVDRLAERMRTAGERASLFRSCCACRRCAA